MPVACMTPLDAEAQRRAETSTDLVWWVLNRHFRRLLPRHGDDLFGEGSLALCVAARNFDPTKARWSTFATASVWGRIMELLQGRGTRQGMRWLQEAEASFCFTGGDDAAEKMPADECARPLPTRQEWKCTECLSPIDWDANRAKRGGYRAHLKRGLCAKCEATRTKARRRGRGKGICARCARLIRSWRPVEGGRYARKKTPGGWCACTPDYPPSFTLAEANEKPAWVLGSDRNA